jgi:uncharacterized coiled-coil DUF342 family protein
MNEATTGNEDINGAEETAEHRLIRELDEAREETVRLREECRKYKDRAEKFRNERDAARNELNRLRKPKSVPPDKTVCPKCKKQYDDKVSFCTCGYCFGNRNKGRILRELWMI